MGPPRTLSRALRGPWTTLWKSIASRKKHRKGNIIEHTPNFLCVTSPRRGFDSLKCFLQNESSATQFDIALHHKVKALSLDPYKRCGLLCETLWLCKSAQICLYFCGCRVFSVSGLKQWYYLLLLWVMFLFSSSLNISLYI